MTQSVWGQQYEIIVLGKKLERWFLTLQHLCNVGATLGKDRLSSIFYTTATPAACVLDI